MNRRSGWNNLKQHSRMSMDQRHSIEIRPFRIYALLLQAGYAGINHEKTLSQARNLLPETKLIVK